MRKENEKDALKDFYRVESVLPQDDYPYIDPETEKNIPWPDKEEPSPTPFPVPEGGSKRKWIAGIILLATALTSGGVGYLEPWQIFSKGGETAQQDGAQGGEPWKATQDQALAAIQAWERLAERALNDYDNALREGRYHPGLCITTGGKRSCVGSGKVVPLNME